MCRGNPERFLMCVVAGEISVTRDHVELATARAGEILGEMALFGEQARSATVTARRPAVLLRLDDDGYDALRRADNRVAYVIERLALEQLVARGRHSDGHIAQLSPGKPSPYPTSAPEPQPSLMDRLWGLFTPKPKKRVGLPRTGRPVHIDRAAALSTSLLFDGADPDHLQAIAADTVALEVGKGQFVYHQNDPGDRWYLIVEGTAELFMRAASHGTDQIHDLAVVGPGEAFGLTSLVDGRPRLASCVTRDRCVVLAMTSSTWHRTVSSNAPAASTLRRAVLRALVQHLATATTALVELERQEISRPEPPTPAATERAG